MQTTKIFKFSRNVFAAAGVAFISCIIARTQAQDASPAKAESSATATSAEKADTEWDGVSVELTSVTRGQGDTITIKFKYTNSGSKAAAFHESNYGFANIATLVYYIDPKNKKKYTALKDSEGNYIVSPMQNITLEPGASKSGWCTLPAPPADVTSITVFIPGAPPFEKVALAAQ
jgi:uncharacterized protein YchJ